MKSKNQTKNSFRGSGLERGSSLSKNSDKAEDSIRNNSLKSSQRKSVPITYSSVEYVKIEGTPAAAEDSSHFESDAREDAVSNEANEQQKIDEKAKNRQEKNTEKKSVSTATHHSTNKRVRYDKEGNLLISKGMLLRKDLDRKYDIKAAITGIHKYQLVNDALAYYYEKVLSKSKTEKLLEAGQSQLEI